MSDENENGIEGVFGGGPSPEATETPNVTETQAPAKKAAPKKKASAKAADPKADYVRIKLAHSKDIPPSGLYLGHNGKGYLLRPGVEADVPEFLLDVLDNAVTSRPVTGADGRVDGWEEQPRFMYSVVRKK